MRQESSNMHAIPEAALFHLHRVECLLSTQHQRRYSLMLRRDMEDLIRLAALSQNTEVRQELNLFIKSCLYPKTQPVTRV